MGEDAAMSMTPTPARGLWRRWLDFWFAPGDPTVLGFMRIVTGCLVVYVHLVYSLDLSAFFGPDGWYGLNYVNRERKEVAHVPPEWGWEESPRSVALPEVPYRKAAVVQYMRSRIAAGRPDLDASLAFIDRLQRSGNNFVVQEGIVYLAQLNVDDNARAEQLKVLADESQRAKVEAAPRVAPLRVPPSPSVVNGMSAEERKKFAADAEAFFKSLPQGSRQDDAQARGYVFSHLSEIDLPAREAFTRFLRELSTLPPEERERRLDYLEYWNFDAPLAHRLGNPIFSIWFHVTDPAGMAAAHVAALVIMVLFTLGLFTRVTSVLTWIAAVSYIHRTQQILFGMDTMMNILLFYLMIGPSGAALSLDRLRAKKRAIQASLARCGKVDDATQRFLEAPPPSVMAGFTLRLIQVHCCFIYMAAGLSKLKGPAWWNTNAYWDTLANPEFTLIHFHWYEALLREIVTHRVVYSVMAVGAVAHTFIVEIGLPFLVWTRSRPFIVILALILHAGIAVFMGLWIFQLLMMTLLLAYLPAPPIREYLFSNGKDGKAVAAEAKPPAEKKRQPVNR
jgi:hypothetical protein